MNTSDYVVRLRADISNFTKNMETAKAQMKQVEGNGGKIETGFKKSFSSATKSTEKFSASISKTSRSVKTAASGMANALKVIGGAVIAAFSVRAIVNFGKESIAAASKLNAMTSMSNKAFGSMAGDVQKWAKSASTSYGLSQRMALQYTSTLGSMAQGFGISQSAAVGLSESIAARIGDLASYYSITQDEAYSKMTAIFTGETESLKSLGIVMTQTALDSFALANGFGKTTAQMSEQEKVMLRYKFVMEQTKLAEGDFAESTARGSWGNQIRRLKLQIEDFKTSVGQGLIVILTPVMSLLNKLMAKLVAVGNAFADMMSKISGKSNTQAKTVVPAVSQLGDATEKASDTAEKAASEATKQAKKATATIMSFDQLHTLSKSDDSSTETTSAPETMDGSGISTEVQSATQEGEKATGVLDKLIAKAKELKKIFASGFKVGFGDTSVKPLLNNIDKIKKSLSNIFNNKEVQESANNMVNSITYALGQSVGAISSMGISIATGLTGGIAQYLQADTPRIQGFLTSMFDMGGQLAAQIGNYQTAVAQIVSVFAGENTQSAIASFVGIISNSLMGAIEFLSQFAVDIETLFTQPIINNVENIQGVIDSLMGFIAGILETVKAGVDETVTNLLTMYDEHISPLFESLTQGISDIIAHFTEAWETYIQPVLDILVEKFQSVWEEHIQPAINKAIEVIGVVADTIKVFWENILKPLIDWIIETVMPVVAPIIELIGSVVMDVFGAIGDAVKTALTVFEDILKFLQDVFKGDWKSAWEDVKKIGKDLWDGIWKTITGFADDIWDDVGKTWDDICDGTKKIWEDVKGFITKPFNDAYDKLCEIVGWIVDKCGFTGITTVVSDALSGIKDIITAPFKGAWDIISPIIDAIKSFDIGGKVASIKNTVGGWASSAVATVGSWIPEFADGGYPPKGDLFIANEAGPELVGTIGGRTAVASGGDIIGGVRQGVMSAINQTLPQIIRSVSQGGGGDVILVLGDEEVARASMRGQKKLGKRYNPSIALG